MAVARNHAIDHYRRRRQERLAQASTIPSVLDGVASARRGPAARASSARSACGSCTAACARCPPTCASRSSSATCRACPTRRSRPTLGVPLGTVKSRINRGRLELAKRLLGRGAELAEGVDEDGMDCQRAEELLSDHLEGTLDAILAAELEAHLAGCAACRALREALGEVVDGAAGLPRPRAGPPTWPSGPRSARCAARRLAARGRSPSGRPAAGLRPLRRAVLAPGGGRRPRPVITPAACCWPPGPTGRPARPRGSWTAPSTPAPTSSSGRTGWSRTCASCGVVISTAFEGRLDRVNDRVDDYRRLLEKRRRRTDEDSKKRASDGRRRPRSLGAEGFRTAPRRRDVATS